MSYSLNHCERLHAPPVNERDNNNNNNNNKPIVFVPLAGIQLHNALLTRDGIRLIQQCYTNTALQDVSAGIILSATSVDKGSRRE